MDPREAKAIAVGLSQSKGFTNATGTTGKEVQFDTRGDKGMENGKKKTRGSKAVLVEPQSLSIANRGVKTGTDFAQLMSTLMSDLISGRVTPQIGNAVCNAGGKLLKIVEMKQKYGVAPSAEQAAQPDLTLAAGL
jgi:hypothetical protein